MSAPVIDVVINNRNYTVQASASILKACEEVSIEVPRFCYHEKLSVAGNCRMCLVEVEKSPKPVVSCAMPLSKNMVIYTNTPLVQKARESVLELLLINHPLDCPICDQGGECDLQDEALQYGSDRGRFFEPKRGVEDKDCGPIIKTIMTRCIHCTRCVRFSAEVAGQETMGSFGRGDDTEIGTYIQSFIKTELAGNLVDLCPVGALTAKPYAYTARSWELRRAETIDFFDAVCADIAVQMRKVTQNKFDHAVKTDDMPLDAPRLATNEEIVRILPRTNGINSDNWISDKTRFAFDALNRTRLIEAYNIEKGSINHGLFSHQVHAVVVQHQNLMLEFLDYWTGGVLLAQTQLGRTAVVYGAMQDFDSVAASSWSLKFFGVNDFHYSDSRLNLNIDLPNFFHLNNGFNAIETLCNLILIGTNPRFEASGINTQLRKQQIQRGVTYSIINPFVDVKFNHNHLGGSLRSLFALIENRVGAVKEMYDLKNSAVFVGVESFKGKNALILQNLSRFLAKKLVTKTKSADFLGTIHAGITTINMAQLGLDIGVRSDLHIDGVKDHQIDAVFALQTSSLTEEKWMSTQKYTHTTFFGTHKPENIAYDHLIPVTSLYEHDGMTFNTEGRPRRFYTVINPAEGIKTTEHYFLLMLRVSNPDIDFLDILQVYNRYKNTFNGSDHIDELPTVFCINYLNFTEIAHQVLLTIFTPIIEDFYMTDLISQNSSVMGESSIFVNPLTPKYFTTTQ